MKKSVVLVLVLVLGMQIGNAQKWKFGANNSRSEIYDGWDFYQKGEYGTALKKFEKVHPNDENYHWAVYLRLKALVELKKAEEGIELAKAGIEKHNSYEIDYWDMLGQLYKVDKDYEAAINTYDTVIKMAPNRHELYFNKAMVYYHQEDYKKAVEELKHLLSINPQYGPAHYRLAEMSAREELYSQAIISFATYSMLLATYENENFKNYTGFIRGYNRKLGESNLAFEEPEEEDEKAKVERMDFSFMNNKYTETDEVIINRVLLGGKKYKMDYYNDMVWLRPLHYIIFNIEDENDDSYWEGFYRKFLNKIKNGEIDNQLFFKIISGQNGKLSEKEERVLRNQLSNAFESNRTQKEIKTTLGTFTNDIEYSFTGFNGIGSYSKPESLEKEGDWVLFAGSGFVGSNGKYEDGEKVGLWKYYRYNGKLEAEKLIEKDKYTEATEWNEYGNRTYYQKKYDNKDTASEYYGDVYGHTYVYNIENEKAKEDDLSYYYSNGTLSYKTTKKNAQKEGAGLAYNEFGLLRSKYHFKEGEEHGSCVSYNDFGKLTAEEQYDKGKKVGVQKYYYDNGKLKRLEQYSSDGEKEKVQFFYSDGKTIKEEKLFKKGLLTGMLTGYYENGKKAYEIAYKKGREDRYTHFDLNGEIMNEAKAEDSELEFIGYYANGKKKMAGSFYRGKKKGTWKYYNRIGNKWKEENFGWNGKLDGTVKTFFASGKVKSKTSYASGDLDGKFQSFFANGEKYEEGYYSDGNKEGEWRVYAVNGEQVTVYFYREGRLQGKTSHFTTSGKLYCHETFENGKLITAVYFDSTGKMQDSINLIGGEEYKRTYSDGKVLTERDYQNGEITGDYVWYYPNGVKEVEGQYVAGWRVGTFTYRYPDGKLKRHYTYYRGYKDSVWDQYYSNGQLKERETYVKGDLHGPNTFFYENGKKQAEYSYKEDKLVGEGYFYNEEEQLCYTKIYEKGAWLALIYPNGDTVKVTKSKKTHNLKFEDGKMAAEFTIQKGDYHGLYTMYHSNGKAQSKIPYNYGYYDGECNFFFANGVKRKTVNYMMGKKHGQETVYYPSGKVKMTQQFVAGILHGEKVEYDQTGTVVKRTGYYNDGIIWESK